MQGNSPQPVEFRSHHVQAVLLALLVTVLWASSWVIIKFGLEDIPPLMFAALRYGIASLLLLGFTLTRRNARLHLRNRPRAWWARLLVYGLIFITATQGAQFLALYYLPAITLSLMLNLTPIAVLLMSAPILKEVPGPKEVGFILLGLLGVIQYFYPLDLLSLSSLGLLIGIGALLSNSVSSITGRAINRTGDTPYLVVTTVSMCFGSLGLMAAGISAEGLVVLSPLSIFYILWLSVVNTAIAFTLWNRAMATLRAIDMTLINSTMMPQIVLLSLVFLGEYPTAMEWVGLLLLGSSVVAVQLLQIRRTQKHPANHLGKG
jgi:drug/metabolite transporter (DMT)-like permease